MNEEIKTERPVYIDRVKGLWDDFGPLVLGALVLLIVLGGAWYLWKNRTTEQAEQPTVIEEQQAGKSSETYLPASEIKFPDSTSSATLTASPIPSTTPKVVAYGTTKGGATVSKGEQLPKTGFPEAILAFSLISTTGGYLLKKLTKKQ